MTDIGENKIKEIRELMQSFIQERFLTKTEKLAPDDPKFQKYTEQFQYDNWLADAARRVGQLQVVTHALKGIHPDAKGTNLYCPPNTLPSSDLVGSGCLGETFDQDVVGNAAALDVYKFLRLKYQGRTLLELALKADSEFIAALSDDTSLGQDLCSAFAGITQAKGEQSSHTRAKQLYWWLGDSAADNANYHLLSPLYATSLAHSVYQTLNEDRFGESAKAARKADREGRFSEYGYQVYPDLAVQKLGGTKPQNISQLNSERGGTNYLLSSLAPTWQSAQFTPILKQESAFKRFNRRTMVRQTSQGLINTLKLEPRETMRTRARVDEYLSVLLDELVMFTSEMRTLPVGWSSNLECKLPEYQKRWLDPRQYNENLSAFEPANLTWSGEVVAAFASSLNAKLKRAGILVGDVEHASWVRRLEKKLALLKEELPYV